MKYKDKIKTYTYIGLLCEFFLKDLSKYVFHCCISIRHARSCFKKIAIAAILLICLTFF